MKKILVAAVLACAAIGGTALGGHTQSQPVWIINGQAGGSLADARSSGDTISYIGCDVLGWAGDVPNAFCSARDENGKLLACNSNDPAVVAAAAAFGPTTYVTFRPTKDGLCEFVWTENLSYYAPPVP